MSTGTPRITAGIILIVALGIWGLLGVLRLLAGLVTGGDGAYLAGTALGIAFVALLLVLAIRGLLLKGLAQRRAFLGAQPSDYAS